MPVRLQTPPNERLSGDTETGINKCCRGISPRANGLMAVFRSTATRLRQSEDNLASTQPKNELDENYFQVWLEAQTLPKTGPCQAPVRGFELQPEKVGLFRSAISKRRPRRFPFNW